MFPAANPIAFFHLSLLQSGVWIAPFRTPCPPSTREWWTVHEVAADLDVNEKTVRRWIHAGKLTAKRAGKGIRIHRNAVRAMLDKDPVGPQPPKRSRGGQLKLVPPKGVQAMREQFRRASNDGGDQWH